MAAVSTPEANDPQGTPPSPSPPAPAPPTFRPGLEGVPATQSAVCDIEGQRGLLTYRGYPIEQLASHSSFLETA